MMGRCGRHRADCHDPHCHNHGVSTLFTYGTLRPGSRDTVLISGLLYNLGWFPGAVLGDQSFIVCEPVPVQNWAHVDAYEGFDPANPEGSLYIRRLVTALDGTTGYFYEFNQPVNPIDLIQSGDWLDFIQTKKGRYGDRRF